MKNFQHGLRFISSLTVLCQVISNVMPSYTNDGKNLYNDVTKDCPILQAGVIFVDLCYKTRLKDKTYRYFHETSTCKKN